MRWGARTRVSLEDEDIPGVLCYGQTPLHDLPRPRLTGFPTPDGARFPISGVPWRARGVSLAAVSSRKLLGQILLEVGVMTQETLDAALMRAQRSHERIGEALIAMRAVSGRRAAGARHAGGPAVPLPRGAAVRAARR